MTPLRFITWTLVLFVSLGLSYHAFHTVQVIADTTTTLVFTATLVLYLLLLFITNTPSKDNPAEHAGPLLSWMRSARNVVICLIFLECFKLCMGCCAIMDAGPELAYHIAKCILTGVVHAIALFGLEASLPILLPLILKNSNRVL